MVGRDGMRMLMSQDSVETEGKKQLINDQRQDLSHGNGHIGRIR